ncbi:MAG: DNA mismatch repair protein MutL, partial [Candidatus Firestonebacteria bacterium]
SIGFDIEIFGKNTLLVRGVPVIISRVNPEKLLLEIAEDLEEYSSIKSVKNLKEEVLKSIACHSAFRSGDNLTNDELVTLLRDFLACDLPYCPHGRPGIIRISFDEIDKKFKRT